MRDRLYVASAQALGVAFLIALGFAALSALLTDGREAVMTIGGLHNPEKMPQSLRHAFLLDMAFPIFYGVGLICLTAALSERSVRPLSRILILTMFIVVLCDFTENQLIMNGFDSAEGRAPYTSIITGVKYGLVGLFAIGLSVLIPPNSGFHRLVILVARIFFPLLMAVHIGLGGNDSSSGQIVNILVSLSFLFMLASLAWIAWQAHNAISVPPMKQIPVMAAKPEPSPKTEGARISQVHFADDEEKVENSDTIQSASGEEEDGFEPVSFRTVSSKTPKTESSEPKKQKTSSKKRTRKKNKR